MTGKELYEKYKGREAEWGGSIGVICGYTSWVEGFSKDDYSLIMMVGYDHGWDEDSQCDGDIIDCAQPKDKAFLYVSEECIID